MKSFATITLKRHFIGQNHIVQATNLENFSVLLELQTRRSSEKINTVIDFHLNGKMIEAPEAINTSFEESRELADIINSAKIVFHWSWSYNWQTSDNIVSLH